MKENFPNLAKEIDFQEVQEAQRVPKKLDPRKHAPRHIIITLTKIKEKERILKAVREKERVSYKGVPIKLSADFSKESLQARRGWKEVFKVMKGKDLHPRLFYPSKLSFRMERQIKCFPEKVKFKEFIGETHRILEHTQNHTPRNQHQKGPSCLWVAEEVTKSQ